jgi:hypothetical protein
MTYDNAGLIQEMVRRHGFDVQEIPMKNAHHEVVGELLIGRDLDGSATSTQFPDCASYW